MQKYKPILPPSAPVESRPLPPRPNRVMPKGGIDLGDSTHQVVQPFQATRPMNRPVLKDHKALVVLLNRYLRSPWEEKAQVPNQFRLLRI